MAEGEQVLHSGDGYTIKKDKNTNENTTWGIYLDPVRGEGVPANMPVDWLDDCTRYQVETLHLSRTGIHGLPAPLAQHYYLQRLHLDGNGLREVPPVVFMLTTLRFLGLEDNRLERLPEEIYQLVHLQWLYLGYNPSMNELPPQMGHRLKQLRGFRCYDTGLPWMELHGGGHRLRGWQLACHGSGAQPPHQTGELGIDCLVIYQEADKETITSICGLLEGQGHHCCTPASDVEIVRFGLQNCKVVMLCVGHSLPLTLLSEVKQSNRPVVAVTLYTEGTDASLKEQLSEFHSLIEYGDDKKCTRLIRELDVLLDAADLPPQIVARGEAAVKVYREAVQNGVLKDRRFPLLVVGAEKVGKTSLIKKLLTGKKFDPQEKSTHVIDVVKVKSSPSLVTWKVYHTKDGATYSEQEYQHACKIAKQIEIDRERKNAIEKKQKEQTGEGPRANKFKLQSPDPEKPLSSKTNQSQENLGEEETSLVAGISFCRSYLYCWVRLVKGYGSISC